ncbi:unnamed protein product [Brachionus calyciflorus]|uniref:BZIP domain-containing protein n=1 Tax=Brachionus calyciflorus TaxID=104777 RepID=A0A814EPQ2_9BILA|nr:unnamed protein product [Brachionus calyciflorus]
MTRTFKNDDVLNLLEELDLNNQKSILEESSNNFAKVDKKFFNEKQIVSPDEMKNIEKELTPQKKYKQNKAKRKVEMQQKFGEELIYFGNSLVARNSAEYKSKRLINKNSVQICREKQKIQKIERERQIEELSRENIQLEKEQTNLNREILKMADEIISKGLEIPKEIESVIFALKNNSSAISFNK